MPSRRRTQDSVEVKTSAIEGLGLFAAHAFKAGQRIRQINVGREVTAASPLRPERGERADHCDYPDGKVVLLGFPDRHINHSCDPNAYVVYEPAGSFIVARRKIAAGEEITCDYNINVTGGSAWPCHCGSARCRGTTVGDFFQLPPGHPTRVRAPAGGLVRTPARGPRGRPETAPLMISRPDPTRLRSRPKARPRSVIVHIATSADGYIARPDGDLDWLTSRPAPRGFYGMGAFMKTIDAKILGRSAMCRNIGTLFNFDPPVTHDEIEAASLQFIRKVSGFTEPSKAHEAAVRFGKTPRSRSHA